MTGLSRRLYSGALNYVLHSQIAVTEAFTGVMLTDGHGDGHITRYTCCRSICAAIKTSVTTTTSAGGVQAPKLDPRDKTHKRLYLSPSCVVFSHVRS